MFWQMRKSSQEFCMYHWTIVWPAFDKANLCETGNCSFGWSIYRLMQDARLGHLKQNAAVLPKAAEQNTWSSSFLFDSLWITETWTHAEQHIFSQIVLKEFSIWRGQFGRRIRSWLRKNSVVIWIACNCKLIPVTDSTLKPKVECPENFRIPAKLGTTPSEFAFFGSTKIPQCFFCSVIWMDTQNLVNRCWWRRDNFAKLCLTIFWREIQCWTLFRVLWSLREAQVYFTAGTVQTVS